MNILFRYFLSLNINKASRSFALSLAFFFALAAQSQCPMPANSPGGTLDTCFIQMGTGFNQRVSTLALQSDGKILVGGAFDTYNGVSRNRICRLMVDGSLDTTFLPSTGFDASITSLAIQPDSKVIVSGVYAPYTGTFKKYIYRLNADGTHDDTFAQTGTGLFGYATEISLQPDGKVLVVGPFTTYNGTPRNHICRLNSDGSLDAGFEQAGTGFNNAIYALALQSDGKVLVGGYFTSYNGTTRNHICRMNSNGSLDNTFAIASTGFDNGFHGVGINSIILQPDGKILVGGHFSSYNGATSNSVCRLNADGSLDPSFVAPSVLGFFGGFDCLALQPDGQILAGGSYYSLTSTAQRRFCRLKPNGSLDTSFNVGTGFNNPIGTLVLQPEGKVLLGGAFTSYNGTQKSGLARLFAPNTTVATKPISQSGITLYPNPAQTHLTLQIDVAMRYKLLAATSVVLQEGIAQPGGSLSVAKLPPGVYSLLLTQGQKVVVKRFVKE